MHRPSGPKKVVAVEMWLLAKVGLGSEIYKLAMNKAIKDVWSQIVYSSTVCQINKAIREIK